MDFIFEFLMEVLVECYFEGFVSLGQRLFPEKKIPKRLQSVLAIAFIMVAIALALGFFIGVCLLVETRATSKLGWWLTAAGAAYIVVGIVLTIHAKIKKEKCEPER